MLDDAIFAWKTGYFERVDVFRANDPGGATFFTGKRTESQTVADAIEGPVASPPTQPDGAKDDRQGMRIDLTRIGVK